MNKLLIIPFWLSLFVVTSGAFSQQNGTGAKSKADCDENTKPQHNLKKPSKTNAPQKSLKDMGFSNTYKIRTNKDTTLLISGTITLTIPKGSFLYKDGSVVKGEIDFGINAYEDLSTMYHSGLATNYAHSPGLESLAMFRMEARANGAELKIGKDIRLAYRTHKMMQDTGEYSLYYSSTGKQWRDADTVERLHCKSYLSLRPRDVNKGYIFEADVPNYLKRYKKLYLAISYVYNFQTKLLSKDIKSVCDFSGGGKSCMDVENEQKVILDLRNLITDSIFVLTGGMNRYPTSHWGNPLTIIGEAYYLEISPYPTIEMVAFINKLGYINIDKFITSTEPLVDFVVSSKHLTPNADVRLFFAKRRAILKGEQRDGQVVFRSVPKGEKVWVAITKTKGDQMGYMLEEALSQENYQIKGDLQYAGKHATMDRISNRIGELFP